MVRGTAAIARRSLQLISAVKIACMFYGIKLCRIKSCGAAHGDGDPMPDAIKTLKCVVDTCIRQWANGIGMIKSCKPMLQQTTVTATDYSHDPRSLGRLIRSRQGSAERFTAIQEYRRSVSMATFPQVSCNLIVQPDQVYPVLVTASLRVIREGGVGPGGTITHHERPRGMVGICTRYYAVEGSPL